MSERTKSGTFSPQTVSFPHRRFPLRGQSTLNWKLRTGDFGIALEDGRRVGYLTCCVSSESMGGAESE